MQKRMRIDITGIVQGVGFRPHIYRLARQFGFSGFVRNNSRGVYIEVQGSEHKTDQFLRALLNQAPPLAVINHFTYSDLPLREEDSFAIIGSESRTDVKALISPDISICDDCLLELFDASDRRYLYPFINCTNCGPRFTIIRELPYDRPLTSMSQFQMCPDCLREYEDPADRRFHAQPNACSVCGPQLIFVDKLNDKTDHQDPVQTTLDFLVDGKIVAIKGIGGFHLAVDATNDQAVGRLRERKKRFEKPLALMVPDIKTAQKIVLINPAERDLLEMLQRPIILCRQRENTPISKKVSLDNSDFGIMLPYSPLHHILLKKAQSKYLVMTSANISEEPICATNEECLERMKSIADAFLIHDRDIIIRCDDSVMRQQGESAVFLRRSRGFTPRPLILKRPGHSVLAVGAHQKNTICLTRDNLAFLSQHVGDLENLPTLRVFEQSINHLRRLLEIDYSRIVYDLHPDYLSTRWAKEQDSLSLFGIQHHYAHTLSVMAEHHLESEIIGFAMDGTGYGLDGTAWGGEVLICNTSDFTRYAHFEYIPMPGGEMAIREPWRMAYAYLWKHLPHHKNIIFEQYPALNTDERLISQILEKNINSPLTSSLGRLFDAVSALLGLKSIVAYEGQAAIILESMANQALDSSTVDIGTFRINSTADILKISAQNIIAGLIDTSRAGIDLRSICYAFHQALIDVFVEIAERIRDERGIQKVALSGGCFQNMILLSGLEARLQKLKFQVYTNRQVPVNDGGICLGQAYWGMLNSEIS